jgi:hypothetical protein
VFDIITPSLSDGVEVALAECMLLVSQVINEFPGLLELPVEFTLFHTKCNVLFSNEPFIEFLQVTDYVLSRVDHHLHSELGDILLKGKTNFGTKRGALLRCGIPRSLIDEIEIFCSQGHFRLNWQLHRLIRLHSKFGGAFELY